MKPQNALLAAFVAVMVAGVVIFALALGNSSCG